MKGVGVSDAQPPPPVVPRARTVLVVSSDPLLLESCRAALAELGWSMVARSECADLAAVLAAPSERALLLDVDQPPGSSAFVALRGLRSAGWSLPVVGVVGSGAVEDIVAWLAASPIRELG